MARKTRMQRYADSLKKETADEAGGKSERDHRPVSVRSRLKELKAAASEEEKKNG